MPQRAGTPSTVQALRAMDGADLLLEESPQPGSRNSSVAAARTPTNAPRHPRARMRNTLRMGSRLSLRPIGFQSRSTFACRAASRDHHIMRPTSRAQSTGRCGWSHEFDPRGQAGLRRPTQPPPHTEETDDGAERRRPLASRIEIVPVESWVIFMPSGVRIAPASPSTAASLLPDRWSYTPTNRGR